MRLLDLLLTLLCVLAPSVATALAPHPSQVQASWARVLLAILGRLSLLRHEESPGTLHLPLTGQPVPVEHAVLDQRAPDADAIEVAFWDFDATRKRKDGPTERDAFKGVVKALLYSGLAVIVGLALAPLVSCTPAQTSAARAATLDWARCAAAPALGQLTTWAARSLESDDWQSWRSALASSLGPALTCALGTLASQIPSDGVDGFAGPEARIQALAAVCQQDLEQVRAGALSKGDACRDPRHRAAWILWQERAAGRLRLGPSGRG